MARGAAVDALAPATVAERVLAMRLRVADACLRAGRPLEAVHIVAAAKGAAPEAVAEAVAAGIRHVGENRVAEGALRRAAVAERVGSVPVVWHLIGALQTNKARQAVEAFDRIDSVGSLRLAEILAAQARERGRRLPVLLQVALGDDPARNGFAEDAVPEAARALAALPELEPLGLMAIGPLGATEGETRNAFERMAALRAAIARDPAAPGDWPELSLGMSADFELAIACGATEVRLGSALFGPRSAAPA